MESEHMTSALNDITMSTDRNIPIHLNSTPRHNDVGFNKNVLLLNSKDATHYLMYYKRRLLKNAMRKLIM